MSAPAPPLAALDDALATVAAGAAARDRDPAGTFPEDAMAALEAGGVLARPATGDGLPYAGELQLLHRVATADTGIARILDGHLNAVERLRVHAPDGLREAELSAIAAGRLRAGVWGADPAPGEGEPARLDGATVTGVKTFCSGAGGLHRALVLVRDDAEPGGPPVAAWLDLTVPGTVAVDRTWFAGAGMRSSASHRVVFSGTPVLALFGPPGALAVQPWFARDAVRTAATWAGAADAAADDALAQLARRTPPTDLEALAAGRLLAHRRSLGLWLRWAGERLTAVTGLALVSGAEAATGLAAAGDAHATDLAPASGPGREDAATVAALARTGLADAARAILDEGERATGSRPLTTGSALDRAGRDLRLFLLQHRLEPILARAGRAALEARP